MGEGHSENWIEREGKTTEADLLKGLVHRKARVACIGAHGLPALDPSPAFLSTLVRSKGVTIIDAQDKVILDKLRREAERHQSVSGKVPDKLSRKLARLETPIENYRGIGALDTYRRALKAQKLPGTRAVKLQPASAWDTGLEPSSHDLVVDRGTWHFIGSKPELLNKSAEHYLNIVKQGGRVVFFGNVFPEADPESTEYKTLVKKLKAIAHEARGRVEHFEVLPANREGYYYPVLKTPRAYSYHEAWVVTKLPVARKSTAPR